MASDDHWQTYLAAWALARQPGFLAFLAVNLPPAVPPTPAELRLLQSLLTDGDHAVRQTSARQLLDLGQVISPETYRTLRQNGIPSKLPEPSPFPLSYSTYPQVPPIPALIPLSEHRRAMRTIMILRENATPAAIEHLKLLAAGHPQAPVTIASQKALAAQTAR